MAEEKKVPTKKGRGWHATKRHVDDNGDIYSYGEFTGYNEETNPEPPETELPPILKPEVKVEIAEEEKVELPTLEPAKEVPKVFNEETFRDILNAQNARIDQLMKIVIDKSIAKDDRPIIIQNTGEDKHKSYPLVMDITPEDYVKEPATFFTRGRGFLLSTYQSEGQFKHPPDSVPIYFEYYYTDNQRRGKYDDIMHYSSFTTHSKKQADYVRSCPKFGLTIFEDVSKVVKYDREVHVMLENLSNKADGLTNERLFAAAAAMGIKDMKTKSKEKLKMEITGIWLTEAIQKQKRDDETRVSRLATAEIFGAEEAKG